MPKFSTALETYGLSLSYDNARKSTLILCQRKSLKPVESIAFPRAAEKGSLVYYRGSFLELQEKAERRLKELFEQLNRVF